MLGAVLAIGLLTLVAVVLRPFRQPPGHADGTPAGVDATRGHVAASYVGRQECAACHAEEARRWQGSHHDLAMQVADERTVLGDFAEATFAYAGVTSRFFRRDGKYLVATDGPDGALHEYEIAYAFGVAPLQQYLIAMPGGRYQALGIAWDARPAGAGGQRWFHLYPAERVTHDDVLHWTKPSQNWNDRCARCHSTNLRRGYRAGEDRYETTWAELDVSCEACHGPGSEHVAAARAKRPADDVRKALVVQLGEPRPAAWVFDGPSGIARRTPPRDSHVEVETCAPCHARCGEVADEAAPGRPLLDDYRPALLDEGLYFPDGQIEDEVYEYGSFLQSRMYRAGVTCSDCHDPHSLAFRAEGNALCARCHLPARFDTPEHHFHTPGSAGAQCVACHMPARTYMGVDQRRDHGFRVPRPDLAAKLGTPDVCTSCHTERTPGWAADAIARRPGPHRLGSPHFGEALWAGRHDAVGAEQGLARLAADAAQPVMARATAVSLLRGYAGPDALAAVRGAAVADDALLRLAAMEALQGRDARTVAEIATPRLDDARRAVRLAAVQADAGDPAVDPSARPTLARVVEEYRAAQRANADRAESHLNLGLLSAKLGDAGGAEEAFETAIRLTPHFMPGYVDLADLYRTAQRDADGERVLRRALDVEPDSAEVHHALGLVLVREQRVAEALPELARAAALAPDDARYAYVLGVALHSTGQSARALDVLRGVHQRRPGDRDVLVALATISRDTGDRPAARAYAAALVAAAPEDEGARRLQQDLDGS